MRRRRAALSGDIPDPYMHQLQVRRKQPVLAVLKGVQQLSAGVAFGLCGIGHDFS